MEKVWKSRDIPCIILDNTSDGIEGCVGTWTWNFAAVKLGHETGDSNLSPFKRSCQDFLKEIANISLRQWNFLKRKLDLVGWRQHLIIHSASKPQCESMWTSKLSQGLNIEVKIFSKSNWKNGSWDWQQSFWRDESWIPIPFVVLFCCIHWCCSFLCNEAVEDVDTSEAGGQKDQKSQIRFRPWEFLQETSVRFGCQMSFPPFAVEKWIVDSFQIFLPKKIGIILCMFENQFFLVPTCKSEQMHYHWKRFFRRAAIFMTFVMFGPLRAKVGYIMIHFFQLINRPIQVHSILKSKSCPCLYRAEDLRMISGANIQKVKCANMILLHHEGFLKETSWNTWEKDG